MSISRLPPSRESLKFGEASDKPGELMSRFEAAALMTRGRRPPPDAAARHDCEFQSIFHVVGHTAQDYGICLRAATSWRR